MPQQPKEWDFSCSKQRIFIYLQFEDSILFLWILRLFLQFDSYFSNMTEILLQRIIKNREIIIEQVSPIHISLKDIRIDLHLCIQERHWYHKIIILKFIFKLDRNNVKIAILMNYSYVSQKPHFSKNTLPFFTSTVSTAQAIVI